MGSEDEFYDNKLGRNVSHARHALAIDELRKDFEPTIWTPRPEVDMKQVWFAGAHSDVGGSYKPDRDGSLLADYPLQRMIKEAKRAGLAVELHLANGLHPSPTATLHKSRRSFHRLKRKFWRAIDHEQGPILIHHSVRDRWNADPKYRPDNREDYVNQNGWLQIVN